MRRLSSGSGLNAILLGVLALVIVVVANYAESIRGAGSSYVLRKADALGWIQPSTKTVAEVREPPPLSVTDERAILAAKGFALYLIGSAILLALLAEHRGETNLHHSAGFVVAASAWVMLHFPSALSWKFVEQIRRNRRHAALQMLAMPPGMAALCALPDDDFDRFADSTNLQLRALAACWRWCWVPSRCLWCGDAVNGHQAPPLQNER